jgi:hypothetical protein
VRHFAICNDICIMPLSVGDGKWLSCVVMGLTASASFLPYVARGYLCIRANRRRRRGAKPRGLGSRDSPAARGWHRPHALTRSAGLFVWAPRTPSKSFVSLASGSRAHDVEQAITPRGQLWGVCF